ncbi:hypothetical protein ACFY12_13195 [Streptomyces sp. NPDC001339]|uniref:hypothetical protein n=1 Tax=Streptomyces sp. NPDC001339 TaxID=3364563 RepID=UPI0036A93526
MRRIRLAAGVVATAALLTLFGGSVASAAPTDNYGAAAHSHSEGFFGDNYGSGG